MVAGAFNAEALVILTDQVGLLKKFPDESTLICADSEGAGGQVHGSSPKAA